MQIAIVYLDIEAMAREICFALLMRRRSVVSRSVSRMQRYDKPGTLPRARKDTPSHKYEFGFRGEHREERSGGLEELRGKLWSPYNAPWTILFSPQWDVNRLFTNR